jgi:ankyrin repeat protein
MYENNVIPILHIAVKNGDIAGIKALLAAGADPNLIALSSPLMGASVLGEAACIAALVQGGADVSLAQPDGTTALLLAAVNGNDLAVKMLLRLGAPIDAMNSNGDTALSMAARHGFLGILKDCIAAGATVDIRSPALRWTPLIVAVEKVTRLNAA